MNMFALYTNPILSSTKSLYSSASGGRRELPTLRIMNGLIFSIIYVRIIKLEKCSVPNANILKKVTNRSVRTVVPYSWMPNSPTK